MALRLIQWIGGKGLLWRWIIDNLPSGNIYVEPFGGAASVLLNKPPHPVEVYNDLNGDLVNLFRVVQDEVRFEKLRRRLEWTMYSYDEFRKARRVLTESDDLDERAWAFYVGYNQGFGGRFNSVGNWGRVFVGTLGNVRGFRSGIAKLDAIHKRMARVQIDNRDALDVIRYWDSSDTVFYIDPPYPHSTRKENNDYKHEMSDSQHDVLIDLLMTIKGNYALSTYQNPLYERLLTDPRVHVTTRKTVAHCTNGRNGMKSKRTEVLYIRGVSQQTLFT